MPRLRVVRLGFTETSAFRVPDLAPLAKPLGLRTFPLPLDVPVPTVTHAARGVAPGYVFVAEKKGGSPGGPRSPGRPRP